METVRHCKDCKTVYESSPDVLCCCSENIDDELHCHVNDEKGESVCVPFIQDCNEHLERCNGYDGNCHDEAGCKCQDRWRYE